jgi:2-dehydropantoate 2-reductase
MNILVFGAGVIGSLYAARLKQGGHRVTLLARGQRLADIRRYGVVLEDAQSGTRSVVPMDTIKSLRIDDQYDLIVVTVRRDQLASIMPELAANQQTSPVLFMLNNPVGRAALIEALGERVMLGFPGAGGTLDGHIVRFAMIRQQPTTLGEARGRRTARLNRIVDGFRASGFRTRVETDMDAWLKAHAFFVTAISGAIYVADGESKQLANDTATLRLMVAGVREGFRAVRALGLGVTPFPLKVLFSWLPSPCAVGYWRRFFSTEEADYMFARHSRVASAEMHQLAGDCRVMFESSGVETTAASQLYDAIDRYASMHSARLDRCTSHANQ